jgi:selenide,water dikinase
LRDEDKAPWIQQLTQLNKIGEQLGKIKGVTAMTDVTGFGLLGHLIEMAEGSGLSASLKYDKVPKLKMLAHYMTQGIVPDATYRNWNAYQPRTYFDGAVPMAEAFSVLADPQTNGGLLFSVDENSIKEVQQLLMDADLREFVEPIGRMEALGEKVVFVEP